MEWNRRAVVGGLAATILPLPTVSAETVGPADGFMVLEAGPGSLRLLPAPAAETNVWAYNGRVPGPLIRIKKGEEVKVRLVNKLAQPTSLSWHGVRITNAMDGVVGLTQKAVHPGESFDYRFTPPDAGFYWYHPHVFPHSAEQIGRGLYGLLVIEEPGPPAADQDVLVLIDDWSLDATGQIIVSRDSRIGDHVSVNSRLLPTAPIMARPGARLRLRFLNACAARIALVTLAGADGLVVAIDGQASEVFPPAGGTLPIGPGARFDLIIDLPNEAGTSSSLLLRGDQISRGDRTPERPLMTILTRGQAIEGRARVTRLPPNARLPTRIPLEKSIKLSLVLGGGDPPAKPLKPGGGMAAASMGSWLWTIDGNGSDGFSRKPLFQVRRGGAVTLAFVNKTAVAQQMHIHGHVFRILHDLDDGWDPYWRESILIGPGKTKHIAFIADNPGKWAVEALVLDRQVNGLAAWFEVI